MKGRGEMTSGIIGLGNMGGRIARRIRDEGLPVLGYDIDAAQAESAGIELADSVAELAAESRVVFLSLPDSTARRGRRARRRRTARERARGPGGRGSQHRGAAARRVRIHARSGPARGRVRRRRHLGRRGRGRAGDAHDHGGRLAGRRWSIVAPILATFSARVYHMGPPGSGHVAKLLNNFLNAIEPRGHGRGDGRGEAGRPRPRAVPRRGQPLERRQLRHAQPLSADHRGRLSRGRPHQRADGQGRTPVPRARAGDRDPEPDRRRAASACSSSPGRSATATRSAIAWSTRSATSPAASASSRKRGQTNEDRQGTCRNAVRGTRADLHRPRVGRPGARRRRRDHGRTTCSSSPGRARTGTPTRSRRCCT